MRYRFWGLLDSYLAAMDLNPDKDLTYRDIAA